MEGNKKYAKIPIYLNKTGKGYYGFHCIFLNILVSIENEQRNTIVYGNYLQGDTRRNILYTKVLLHGIYVPFKQARVKIKVLENTNLSLILCTPPNRDKSMVKVIIICF